MANYDAFVWSLALALQDSIDFTEIPTFKHERLLPNSKAT